MKLNELLLNEAIQTFYHGSPTAISKFSFDHLDFKRTNQEGPGIYLTSSKEDAKTYGKHVHTVQVNVVKSRLMPEKHALSMEAIRALIWRSPDFKNYGYTNWDEDPKRGLTAAATAIMDAYGPSSYREAMEQIWADYYRDDSALYLSKMRVYGWDGFIIPRTSGVTHLVWFNVDAIKIIE